MKFTYSKNFSVAPSLYSITFTSTSYLDTHADATLSCKLEAIGDKTIEAVAGYGLPFIKEKNLRLYRDVGLYIDDARRQIEEGGTRFKLRDYNVANNEAGWLIGFQTPNGCLKILIQQKTNDNHFVFSSYNNYFFKIMTPDIKEYDE